MTCHRFPFHPAASSVLLQHGGTVDSLAFSPNARWLVAVSRDGQTRLWDLNIDSLLERAKQAAGRKLTPEERERYMLD